MADELTVPAAAAGERLDVFLAGHAGSRAAAQRLIDGGQVTVDGGRAAKRHLLAGGERVARRRAGRGRAGAPRSRRRRSRSRGRTST